VEAEQQNISYARVINIGPVPTELWGESQPLSTTLRSEAGSQLFLSGASLVISEKV